MNLETRINEINQLRLDKYEVVSVEALKDLDSVGLVLKHKKSGARVIVMTNEDDNKVFSIGFKTPAYNDTGLQHILEHSVLCGSKKYPVKDPFVELCKGSLNTFLNAMTYPDKTVYPVASCNLQDFKNIMDVYMDAVFYPAIYDKQEIFKQEGWHYELESVDDDLAFNGVVFNEMKGVYSSPDDVLARYTFSTLFPDTNYSFESGGDPACIPNLTYEEFLDYHKNYYHPANSYIYLYGDFDVQERLDYLDNEYLSDFEAKDAKIDADIKLQKAFDKPVDVIKEYAITEDEPLEDNAYLSLNKVVGTSLDAKLYLGLQILDYVLIMAPGAKLKQALIDRNIGTDIYSSVESSMYQPIYSIIAKNVGIEKKQEFLDTINEVLEDIVANGIDERMVDAAINYYEFKYREADFGPYPKGLMNYLTMMDSWLYDDSKPFRHVEAGETFEEIKKDKCNGYFEGLIKEYLLDNNHASVVCLVPKRGLEAEIDAAEKARLAAYKATLSKEELEKLVADTKALKEYQDEESSQEDLEKIPMLELDDIAKEPQKFYNDEKQIAGVDVIHHNMFTNRIAYIMMAFDCKSVPEELIPYIGLLSTTLGLMDTENYTYPELTNEININCGGITTDAAIYTDTKDLDKYRIMYEVKGKVLFDKMDFVPKMIKEIIYGTKFNDYKRLKEIIARVKSRLESSMTGSGHSVAMLSGMAQFSPTGYYSNMLRGYSYYKLIKELDDNFDEKKEDIAAKLKELTGYIFTKENLIVSFNANDEGYDAWIEPMTKFAGELVSREYPVAERHFAKCNIKTGYTSSSMVQYVARCGNFVEAGHKYTGALKVLKVIFSYEYLWLNVRVKGGAYGCMSGFSRNGDMYMVSYRDPNLRKTNDIYEGAAEYIRNFNVSDRDMLKFIIGTVGDLDSPLNPSAKGIRSFGAYICHTDYETVKRERNEVLGATVESIRALAPLVEAGIGQNYFCVVGNQKNIQDESAMFDKIEPLFIAKH
ncbi:MAG: insulinase family protein [Lachnospira sp.]|nr:insulinase family protein [Lachnospira sp.]